jgi:hypothetical protein
MENNNKLIAEFLGFQQTNIGWYDSEEVLLITERDNTFDDLKFNTDWNWLMEAVDKIESFGYDVFINTCVCRITDVGQNMFEDIECFVNDNKRQATYNALVEFIKWYNEQ